MLTEKIHLVAHTERIDHLPILLSIETENPMLLSHSNNTPLRPVRHPTIPGCITGLLGEGDGAGVDESLVPLGVDAANLRDDPDGLLGFGDQTGGNLLEVVGGIVSCPRQRGRVRE